MSRLKPLLAAIVVSLVLLGGVALAASMTGTLSEHSTDSDFGGSEVDLTHLDINGTGDSAAVENIPLESGSSLNLEQGTESTNFVSYESGVIIDTNTKLTGLSVSFGGSEADTLYIIDHSTDETVASKSYSGSSTSIYVELEANKKYRVVTDAGGDGYSHYAWEDGVPQSSSDFDVTNGWSDGATTSRAEMVKSISVEKGGYESVEYVGNHSALDPETAVVEIDELADGEVSIDWERYDGSAWQTVDSTNATTAGTYTTDLSSTSGDQWRVKVYGGPDVQNNDWTFTLDAERLEAETYQPEASVVEPTDGGEVTDEEVDLVVDVSDGDFTTTRGDEVTVTFYDGDENVIGTNSTTENGTVSVTWSSLMTGDNTWYAVAEDEYGGTDQTETVTFTTPDELHIFNETSPEEYVDGSTTVTVQFFGGDTIVERETTDGTVDLSGLPVDETLIVRADADGYHNRRIVIDSLFEQDEIYLLDESVETVETRFELEDHSGEFSEDESYLIVQKPITKNGSTEWRTILADEFGAQGVTGQFEADARYRLVIENDVGATREYGTWTASVSETITLEIGDITFEDLEGEDDYEWGAQYAESGEIQFRYSDPRELTDSLEVSIVERGNESNEIYSETHGPLGNLTVTHPLEEQQQNKTWKVVWEAERGGETISGSTLVGENIQDTLDTLDPKWRAFAAVTTMIVIGGAMGAVAAGPAAVAVSIVGGLFYYIGWLPVEVGAIFVLIALTFGILYTMRRSS